MYKSILVPVDGSVYARKALEVAAQIANADNAVIYLLNVPELPEAADTLGQAAGARAMDLQSEEEAKQAGMRLVERLKQAEQDGHGLIENLKSAIGLTNVEIEPLVKLGSPPVVISGEAARLNVEAIVMGSRGLSEWKGLVVGSVSNKVMNSAQCTVIIVH